MKKRFSKVISMITVLSVLASMVTVSVSAGKNLFDEDFSGNWTAAWNESDTQTGVVASGSGDTYVTAKTGKDKIVMPNTTITDANFKVRFKLLETGETYPTMHLILRDNATDGSYRMVFEQFNGGDSSPGDVRLQKFGADEKLVGGTMNKYGYGLLQKNKEYEFGFSVKDGLLRAEINGELLAMATDYTTATPTEPGIKTGGVAIETFGMKIEVLDVELTGEDRLYHNDFDSDKFKNRQNATSPFGINGGNDSNATVTSDGLLVFEPYEKNNAKKDAELYIKGSYSDTSAAWKNTKISFDVIDKGEKDYRGGDGNVFSQMFLTSHRNNAADSYYKKWLHSTPNATNSYDSVYKFASSYTEKNINKVNYEFNTNSIAAGGDKLLSTSLQNKTFHINFITETASDDSSVTLKTEIGRKATNGSYMEGWLDKVTVNSTSAADGTSEISRLGGGVSVINTSGKIYIDNLELIDTKSATKHTEYLYTPMSFGEWMVVGKSNGTVANPNNVYKVNNGQNGILNIKDYDSDNVQVSADVVPNMSDIKEKNSYVALYARYTGESDYVEYAYTGDKVKITKIEDGVPTQIATADVSGIPTKFNMEFQVKNGIYRGLINGKVVIYGQDTNYKTSTTKGGTVGIGAYDCAAEFDNVAVDNENRIFYTTTAGDKFAPNINSLNDGTLSHIIYRLNFDIDAYADLDGIYFVARDITGQDNNWKRTYKYSLSGDENNAYGTLLNNDWSWNDGAKSIKDALILNSNNVIEMEIEDIGETAVKITVRVNGTQITSVERLSTEAETSYISADKNGSFSVADPKNKGSFVSAEVVSVTETEPKLDLTYNLNTQELVAGSEVKADLVAVNTLGVSREVQIFTVLYDETNCVRAITEPVICSITNSTQPQNFSAGTITIPEDTTGLRVRAYCWSTDGNIAPIAYKGDTEASVWRLEGKVRPIGRGEVIDAARSANWPGSGIEFKTTATEVKVKAIAKNYVPLNVYSVYVDGVEKPKVTLDNGWNTIASGLTAEEHTIKLVRSSEANALGWIADVEALNGDQAAEITPTESKTRKMEFYGDSYTVGYGNLVSDADYPTWANPDLGDHQKSYAALTADYFDADANVIAYSGKGMSKNGTANKGLTIPELANLADVKINGSESTPAAWDFSEYTPDVVVVFLGTNDAAGKVNADTYKSAYKAFLTTLTNKYPLAKIVCMTKNEETDKSMQAETWSAVEEMNNNNISVLKINNFGYSGGVKHPNAAEHEAIATQLKTYVSNLMSWN